MDRHDVSIAEINATLDRIVRDREQERIAREQERIAREQERIAKEKARDKEREKDKARLDAWSKEWNASMAVLREQVMGMSASDSKFSESYFYETLKTTMLFGGIKYDIIDKGLSRLQRFPDGSRVQGEYDVIMYNKDTIALIEVKYRARKGDADDLINRKLKNFKILFPDYANYTFYLGIAGMGFDDNAEADVRQKGIAILKPKGESVVIEDKHLKAY